jgi:hypothetical protein
MAAPGAAPTAQDLEGIARKSRLRLFGLLFVCSVAPLFFNLSKFVPNKPVDQSIDLYTTLMGVPDNSTILVQTDWTNSTRGESGGEFESIMRILMRKHCKLALFSNGDPNAPRVAMDDIITLNADLKASGQPEYQHWTDYVNMGFFPNAEGANNAEAANLRSAWAGKKDVDLSGQATDVFKSPVLQNVHTIKDCPLIVIITASNTFNVLVERMSDKMPVVAAVTGVMGPESQVYYASKQIKGLATGVKGVYDMETLMENGINWVGPDGKVGFSVPNHATVPGWRGPGIKNYDRGQRYFPTLIIDLVLLICAVIAGNIGMFRARKKEVK